MFVPDCILHPPSFCDLKPSNNPPQVPYKDKILTGKALEDQVDKWVSYGTIEPSAGAAIKDVSQNREWRDLSDRYFVLLGAGSAMGPLKLLLELGANIVAIDLDRPGIWQRLLDLTENSCGTITFPLKEGKPQASLSTRQELCAAAGANLLAHTPEILNWCDGRERGAGVLESILGGEKLLTWAYTRRKTKKRKKQ